MRYKAPITLAALMMLLQGCGDESSRVKGEFIRGCIQTGGTKSACNCVYDKFTDKHEAMELEKLSAPTTKPTDQVVQDLANAAMACRES